MQKVLSRSSKDVDVEMFVLAGQCGLFIDGLCSLTHCFEREELKLVRGKRDVFYTESYGVSLPDRGCKMCVKVLQEGRFDVLAKVPGAKVGGVVRADAPRYQLKGCRLCDLYDLKDYPIRSLKIVGRDMGLEDRVKQAVFLNALPDIGRSLEGASRWYMGHEFCEKLIFSTLELNKRLAVARAMGKAVTLVTPYVTEMGMDRIRQILPFLDGDGTTEVVFNDWGVFYLLEKAFPKLVPVMGRVLSRQKLKAYHGSFPANSKSFQQFLMAHGIRRVELDCLLWDMKVDVGSKIAPSFYGPYGYVATGRMCPKLSLTPLKCEKTCQSRYFQWEDSGVGVFYLIVGGTLFYRNDAGFKGKISSCDRRRIRIVRQLEKPS